MIVVSEVEYYGGACPWQLEGKTDKGERVYARYRWGRLRIEVDGEVVFALQVGEDQDDDEVLRQYEAAGMKSEMLKSMAESFRMMRTLAPGEPLCYDGVMTLSMVRELTAGEIQWPEGV